MAFDCQFREDAEALGVALESLGRVSSASSGEPNLNHVLHTVTQEAMAVLGLEGASLCLVTPERTLSLVAQKNLSRASIADLETHKVKIGDCLCGMAALEKTSLILRDADEVRNFASREAMLHEGIRFHAAYPLLARDRCFGVLCAFTKTDSKPTEGQLQALEIMSAQAGMTIDNARLFEEKVQKDRHIRQAYVDVLHAVTNGRLVLVTENELEGALGQRVGGSFDLRGAEDLASGRDFIRQVIAEGFPGLAGRSGEIVLAACEAMTNAVKHADGGLVAAFDNLGRLQVTISDTGPGIDFSVLPKATLMSGFSTKRSLGMGFDIMLEYCDKLLLSTGPEGTVAALEFEIDKA